MGPTLEYAGTIWDLYKKYRTDRIEMVERGAAKFILSRYGPTDSVTEMLNELKLPLLSERR